METYIYVLILFVIVIGGIVLKQYLAEPLPNTRFLSSQTLQKNDIDKLEHCC